MDKTTDGGSIASGFGGLFGQRTGLDPILVKFDAQGRVVWGKRYATPGTQFNIAVRQTKDLGFIAVGQHTLTVPSLQAFYLIKINSIGDTLWCKSYDTGKPEVIRSVAEVSDGYIISGHVVIAGDTIPFRDQQGKDTFYISDRQNVFAMKIDRLGGFKWGKLYGDSTKKTFIRGSIDAYDGGVTIVGQTFAYGNTFGAAYVIHTDKEGNIGAGTGCQIRNLPFTTTTFRVTDSTNVIATEGGEEFGGYLRRQAISITKTDICSGTGINTDVADYRLPENTVKIYPNPVNSRLFVEIAQNTEGSLLTVDIKIFDATGRLIQSQKNVNDTLQIDVSAYAHGIYLLKVERGGKYLVKKFIVE